MRDLLDAAIESALNAGAEYADARIVSASWESVRTYDQQVIGVDRGQQLGIGIRVRLNGGWGFSTGTHLVESAVRLLAIEATELARATSLLILHHRPLPPAHPYEAMWSTPVNTDPFSVSIDDRAERLYTAERAARRMPIVYAVAGQLSASKERKYFANSEGSFIIQERTVTGLNCQAFSEGQQGTASRHFPYGKAGHYSTGGLESIDSLDLIELGQQAGTEATELVTAPPAPTGDMDVILTGSQVATLLHETCGRFAELDWNMGLDGSDSVQRVISPENIDQFRFGSPLVTITADASLPGGMGTFGFDDEGFPANQLTLVDNGIWSGFLTNREHAGTVSRSDQTIYSSRAGGFNRSPQVRMPNVSLRPGQGTLADLISDTEYGIIIDSPIQFVIDPIRGWFRCLGEIGWEVERGEKRQMVRSPAYEGQITYFWQSCDAVCGEEDWSLYCHLDSSRGYPVQSVSSSHGAAPCRFRGVRVDTAKPW